MAGAAAAAVPSVMDDFRRAPPRDWSFGDVEFTQGLVSRHTLNHHALVHFSTVTWCACMWRRVVASCTAASLMSSLVMTMRAVAVHVDEFRAIHRGMAMVVSAVDGVCDRRGHGRTHCT